MFKKVFVNSKGQTLNRPLDIRIDPLWETHISDLDSMALDGISLPCAREKIVNYAVYIPKKLAVVCDDDGNKWKYQFSSGSWIRECIADSYRTEQEARDEHYNKTKFK